MLNFVILLELLAVLKCNLFFIGSLNSTATTVYIRPTATVVVTMNASKMPQQMTSLPNHKTSVKGIEKFFDSGYFCCDRCCFSCRCFCCLYCYYCYCCCYCCCWYCCCCYCCCCCCYTVIAQKFEYKCEM